MSQPRCVKLNQSIEIRTKEYNILFVFPTKYCQQISNIDFLFFSLMCCVLFDAGHLKVQCFAHLSMLITHRVMMDAVQHMTSMAMKTLQKNCPKIH